MPHEPRPVARASGTGLSPDTNGHRSSRARVSERSPTLRASPRDAHPAPQKPFTPAQGRLTGSPARPGSNSECYPHRNHSLHVTGYPVPFGRL